MRRSLQAKGCHQDGSCLSSNNIDREGASIVSDRDRAFIGIVNSIGIGVDSLNITISCRCRTLQIAAHAVVRSNARILENPDPIIFAPRCRGGEVLATPVTADVSVDLEELASAGAIDMNNKT